MTTHERGRPTAEPARPVALWLYVLGALGLGVSALVGGGSLILDPTGAMLSMPLSLLSGTPFRDFLVPGLVLFAVFGVGSFVVLFGIARRLDWAWVAAVGLGAAQVGWILVEVLLIRTVDVLHVVYGGLGLLLVALALSAPVRTALRR